MSLWPNRSHMDLAICIFVDWFRLCTGTGKWFRINMGCPPAARIRTRRLGNPLFTPTELTRKMLQPRLIHSLIARFTGPTWGPSGTDRTQLGPMLAPRTFLAGQGRTIILIAAVPSTRYTTPCLLERLMFTSTLYQTLYEEIVHAGLAVTIQR